MRKLPGEFKERYARLKQNTVVWRRTRVIVLEREKGSERRITEIIVLNEKFTVEEDSDRIADSFDDRFDKLPLELLEQMPVTTKINFKPKEQKWEQEIGRAT